MNDADTCDVVFHRGEDRIAARLQPVDNVRFGHNYGGTWYRIWTEERRGGLDTSCRAHGLLRFRHGVLSLPCDGPIRAHGHDPASRWVEGFPHLGDVCRWATEDVAGEWLTAPEAAAYLSAVLGRRVSSPEVRALRGRSGVEFLCYGHYKRPLVWEGSLRALAGALR